MINYLTLLRECWQQECQLIMESQPLLRQLLDNDGPHGAQQ